MTTYIAGGAGAAPPPLLDLSAQLVAASQPGGSIASPERLLWQPPGTRAAARAALGAHQHGAVHRAQLRAFGYSDDAVQRACLSHHLHPVSRDVFAVGYPRLQRLGRGIAALLQVGPTSCLSHTSAARVWGLIDGSRDGPIHVSTTDRRHVQLPAGTTLHRPRALLSDEVVLHRGLPVTSPERTLIDVLPSSSVTKITRLLERMVTVLGRSPDQLHEWGHGLKAVKGKHRLLRALDNVVGPVILRSLLEEEFRSLCEEAGFPLPETNVKLGRWEVDVLWRRLGLIVELDSWRFHGGKWEFHRDRRKGLALAADGYEVLRLTWAQVKHERAVVVAALRQVLARRDAAVA